jgi:hypothetical protein
MSARHLDRSLRRSLRRHCDRFASHDSAERAAAAATADDLIRRRGLTSGDVLRPERPRPRPDAPPLPNVWTMARARLAAGPFALSAWEREFCRDVKHRAWLSPSQFRVLVRLYRRVTKASGKTA